MDPYPRNTTINYYIPTPIILYIILSGLMTFQSIQLLIVLRILFFLFSSELLKFSSKIFTVVISILPLVSSYLDN